MAGVALAISCCDGYGLRGHLRETPVRGERSAGAVVVAGATGVKASYYHCYAAFLAEKWLHAYHP